MVLPLLPAVITLPRAGSHIPIIGGDQLIEPEQTSRLIDALNQVVDLSHRVAFLIKGDIHPEVMDLDCSPEHAVKLKVNRETKDEWLQTYYDPFHWKIKSASQQPAVKIGVNCTWFDPPMNQPEAIISLSNQGDSKGLRASSGKKLTCSTTILRDVLDIATAVFVQYDKPVLLNANTGNGYLINHYATDQVPWIEIGLSKKLLIGAMVKRVDQHRKKLQEQLQQLITYLFKIEAWMN